MSAPLNCTPDSCQTEYQVSSDVSADNESEETETASEVMSLSDDDSNKTPMKDQLYHAKLEDLTKQLEQVKNRSHPEYLKRVSEIRLAHQKRIDLNDAFLKYEQERIDIDFRNEITAAKREFRVKKAALQETLVNRLEDSKKSIASELPELSPKDNCFYSMARKLRGQDSSQGSQERARHMRANGLSINYLLDDDEIAKDLRRICPCHSSASASQARQHH